MRITAVAHSERRIQTQWDLADTNLLCEFKLIYKDNFNYTSRPYGRSIVLNCLALGVSRKRTRHGKWNDDLNIMSIAKDNNFPRVHVVWAVIKQYLINKLSRVIVSILQGTELFARVINYVSIHGG